MLQPVRYATSPDGTRYLLTQKSLGFHVTVLEYARFDDGRETRPGVPAWNLALYEVTDPASGAVAGHLMWDRPADARDGAWYGPGPEPFHQLDQAVAAVVAVVVVATAS